MHGAGHKGKLPPVVERALSWYAGHGGMVAELRGGGKDFGAAEVRSQRSEIKARSGKSWEAQAHNQLREAVGGLLEKRKSLGEVPRRLSGSG